MPKSNLERSLRAAWLLGLAGASVWMPVLTWSVLAAGDATGGIVGTGWYGACLGMSWYLSPWRNPGVPLWKLLSICLGSILGGAVFFILRYRLYEEGSRHFLWSMLALIAMFLPAFLVGRKTWRDFFPS
jgi:hypothetical protein